MERQLPAGGTTASAGVYAYRRSTNNQLVDSRRRAARAAHGTELGRAGSPLYRFTPPNPRL